MTPSTPILQFIAGHPTLDFTNTLHGRLGSERFDHLTTYPALIRWARKAGLVEPAAATALRRLERNDPGGAEDVLNRAIRVREALYAVMSAASAGRSVPPKPLSMVNRELAKVGEQSRLTPAQDGSGFRWDVREPLDLMTPLRVVIWTSAELLASDAWQRVRECAAPECSWLFLDGTRNHSRRWCDTMTCGNRERLRRYYRRQVAGVKGEA